ncbi:peroxidase, putative [Talaromyces stipitatus ATCC 10500]|uniref:Peroxidase, putative n=1 Tax=Talaromyces stipitatus (strain ATCC 10500 / CBS 375.48 / QM 6759 / NRRL 1006) TaxID=441959 RepID=B8LZ19_TALSN|nr:peroxidase, putative [Talaromyces stipitatus ATCC 10500]EED21063.1 peroxidase, putative [Talaromyces stipitatus ATCC 10500]
MHRKQLELLILLSRFFLLPASLPLEIPQCNLSTKNAIFGDSVLGLLVKPGESPIVLIHPWIAPGPDADKSLTKVRGPCPALNTTANHGFIPRSGRNITMDDLIPGLKASLNVAEDIAIMAGTNAFKTNPAPSATVFDLDMLNLHGAIEHDNSLSRGDYYFGDNHSFNETIYAETRAWFHESIISLPQAVSALRSRIETSRKTNPHFFFDLDGSTATTASYLSIFGDTLKGEARRDWVDSFFQYERLPIELGWTPPALEFNMTLLLSLATRIANMLPGDLITQSVESSTYKDGSHWVGGIVNKLNRQQEL